MLLYNFGSTFVGETTKTLYVLSLVRSLERINEKELVRIFSLTKQQRKYSFPFSLLKATMFLPIREKL